MSCYNYMWFVYQIYNCLCATWLLCWIIVCVSGKRPDAETDAVLSSAAERSHRAARLAADPAARVDGRSHREERSERRADDGAGGRRCAQGSSSAGGQRWGNAPVREKVLKIQKIKILKYSKIKNLFIYLYQYSKIKILCLFIYQNSKIL